MNFLGFLQSLLGGIGTGTIYALLGLSCSLILGRLQICSVVHGDFSRISVLSGISNVWG
jgi:branched-subunit amino acid ABC-type transport system permease component